MFSFGSTRVSFFLLVVAGVFWGTGGLAGDLLQDAGGIGPVSVAAYRLLVGGVVASIFVLVLGAWRGVRGVVWRIVLAGALLAQFQAAYQVSVDRIGVSLATLLTIGCVPLFVTFGAAVRERGWPSGRALFSVFGSVVGLLFLCWGGGGSFDLVGVGASLFAGGGFSLLTLLGGEGRFFVTSVGLLVGGLFLVPLGLVGGMAIPLRGEVVGLVLFLGVVPTAVAYGAYFLGLRVASPIAAALSTMLEPLTATLLSVGLRGEQLSSAGVVGALFIGGALAFYYLA